MFRMLSQNTPTRLTSSAITFHNLAQHFPQMRSLSAHKHTTFLRQVCPPDGEHSAASILCSCMLPPGRLQRQPHGVHLCREQICLAGTMYSMLAIELLNKMKSQLLLSASQCPAPGGLNHVKLPFWKLHSTHEWTGTEEACPLQNTCWWHC